MEASCTNCPKYSRFEQKSSILMIGFLLFVMQFVDFFRLLVLLYSAGCYPFTDRDPFFIETCPHVYFVGNQDKYETSLIKGNISCHYFCYNYYSILL